MPRLGPDERAARREAAQDADGRADALRRARRAGRRLRRVATTLLDDTLHHTDRLDAHEVGTTVATASPRARTRFLRALHPRMGDLLVATFDDLAARPYTIGHQRRAFRAPGSVEATARARGQWLQGIAHSAPLYPRQDADWFAAWAGHLTIQNTLGQVFASAIDRGDTGVRDILLATVDNTHDVAVFGPHVPIGLLGASDPTGWDAVERLLLAARRQAGLRQAILEAVDLAHPAAFRRMVRLVLDEDLLRFAAAIRAVGVWFGEDFEVRDKADVADALATLLDLLDDPDAQYAALDHPDPLRVYLSLWAQAHVDAAAATDVAAGLLAHDRADTRLAAARLLHAIQLPGAHRALVPALADDDLRVAAVAHDALVRQRWTRTGAAPAGLVDGLWTLQERLDDQVELPVGISRAATMTLAPAQVCDGMVHVLDDRPPSALAPLVDRMSPDGRAAWVRRLAAAPDVNRDLLLARTADLSSYVRGVAFRALEGASGPTDDEARELEDLLTRKASDLRHGVLALLLARDEPAVLASVQRLAEGRKPQRRAAIELLAMVGQSHLVGGSDAPPPSDEARTLARELVDRFELAEGDRDRLAELLLDDDQAPPRRLETVEDLVDDAGRTPVARPTRDLADVATHDEAVAAVVGSLDRWLVEHRDVEVTIESWQGPEQRLLGDLRRLPRPRQDRSWDDQSDRMPLPEIIDPWWERTAGDWSTSRVELALVEPVQALLWPWWQAGWHDLPTPPDWHRERLVARWPATTEALADATFRDLGRELLDWLVVRELTGDGLDGLLATAAGTLAAVPTAPLAELPSVADLVNAQFLHGRRDSPRDVRNVGGILTPLQVAARHELVRPDTWTIPQRAALWRLLRFVDQPNGIPDRDLPRDPLDPGRYHHRPDLPHRPARRFPTLATTVRAVTDGSATRDDLADVVLGEETQADGRGLGTRDFGGWAANDRDPLGELTRRRATPLLRDHDWVPGFVDELRDRILAVELARGDLPTPASRAANQLRTVVGADVVARVLAALGRHKLARGWSSAGDTSRPVVLSHLVRVAFPGEDDTPETFAAAIDRHDVPDRRLPELAVYAPQWAGLVEAHVGWEGLEDAVWWLHAHTKDQGWSVDADVRAEWEALSHERTPLTATDLLNGAVDVDWFVRVRDRLGDERLDRLLKVAKYASSSGGHVRARLFADAIRGTVAAEDVLARMQAKRHQDSVRAVGLLPLPDDPDEAGAATLDRYERLMAWQKGSRKFGQQRRASEALAVDVAMDNLARTAGYRDPQRLGWTMEAEAVADLADGPVTATVEDVTVALSLADDGTPRLDVDRAGRVLKNIPRDAAKDPAVVALRDRVKQLRDQASRMRTSLEDACVRGDVFTPDELAELAGHPILAGQLSTLVVVDRTGRTARPADGGRRLVDVDGAEVGLDGAVRLAHPVDLLAEDRWHDWQRLLFDERIRQPFRQVFRRVYVPVGAEVGGATRSDRWAGHQVQSRQAAALFGRRGWVLDHEGGARRTWHRHGITAHVTVMGLWGTPGEVEDSTLESVWFVDDRARPVVLDDVPPRLFSEVMRDLDLVVSVAHAGGVDPEATASTVEMRSMLVDETIHMLGLDNVELTDNHALVTGHHGTWSIHLGSAVVHRRPGNAVCIVPVGAQHRGRLFLPFVDDDPRTAEVVSKVVLLARDDQIQDPSILAQLRG